MRKQKFIWMTCVGLPSTYIVSPCGSWKAKVLARSVLRTSCAARTLEGSSIGPSPLFCKASSWIALHRSDPGAPAVRRCCTCLALVETSQAGSPADPELELAIRLLCDGKAGERLCVFFWKQAQGSAKPAAR